MSQERISEEKAKAEELKNATTQDYFNVGERVFQVIPLTHSTGERFCGYLQMARGKTSFFALFSSF